MIVIAFVAGVIAGISPCIIPVLPVVFAAGATSPIDGGDLRGAWRRPVSIVAGLVLSFSLLVLFGSEVISLLHLPQQLLRDLGIAMLMVVGIGLLVPRVGEYLERPFARVMGHLPSRSSGGFVIGLALGLVFVPCAGPVLAAITVLGATHHLSLATIVVTFAFAAGSALPLLFIALSGERLVGRVRSLREHAPVVRRVGGAVMVVMAVLISTNALAFLQRDVPGYTSALQRSLEGSSSVRRQLAELKGASQGSLSSCNPSASTLIACGTAPNFAGITAWLNTPGERPLTMSGLRGKVVLVDFWTYSCINCQRSLPHVEAWWKRYERYGLEVVGVHTPEFAFEHVVGNVAASASSLGVSYPVAVDDNYSTWNAYSNEYWPAEYLIDAKGVVRHVDFGEGGYTQTEQLIRTLLVDARPGLVLPPPTSVANLTPTEATNPESYVGYHWGLEYLQSPIGPVDDRATRYRYPSTLSPASFALAGVWTIHAEEATAGRGASLELSYFARDVYLVMGGRGPVQVTTGDGTTTIRVNGVPRLYTLAHFSSEANGTMVLHVAPGVEAFDFTFG